LVIKSFEGTTRPLYLEVDIVRNFIIFEKDKVTIKNCRVSSILGSE